jgi:hypothetical protein
MNTKEARAFGRIVKRHAKALVEMGDVGTIVLNVEWQVVEQSHHLGIVDADGMVDVSGEVARAFREGFTGRRFA